MTDGYSKCLDCKYEGTPDSQTFCNYCRSVNIEGGLCSLCKQVSDDCVCWTCDDCETKRNGDDESPCESCDICNECCECIVCENCDTRGVENVCISCANCEDCCECDKCSECSETVTEYKCKDCLVCKNCECEHFKKEKIKIVKNIKPKKKTIKKQGVIITKKKKFQNSKTKNKSSKLQNAIKRRGYKGWK